MINKYQNKAMTNFDNKTKFGGYPVPNFFITNYLTHMYGEFLDAKTNNSKAARKPKKKAVS